MISWMLPLSVKSQKRPFRIVPQELKFYREHNLPLRVVIRTNDIKTAWRSGIRASSGFANVCASKTGHDWHKQIVVRIPFKPRTLPTVPKKFTVKSAI